jgi:hypothetical protein
MPGGESKSLREFKKQRAKDQARRTRDYKKRSLEQVIAKETAAAWDDVTGIFNGLSRAAIELAAYHRINELIRCGMTPREILKIMEPERRKKA